MRDIFVATGDLVDAMGGSEMVGRMLALSPKYIDRYGQNPDKGGKTPSLEKSQELITIAGNSDSEKVQGCLDRWLSNFISPAKRFPVREEAFTYWDNIKNGIYTPRQEVTVICDSCKSPLIYVPHNGALRAVCAGCGGK